MKTVNNILGVLRVILFLLLLLLVISGCNIKGCEIRYPEPKENPVYLSSEAQTNTIHVENITWIVEENSDTDIVEQTDTSPRWIIIKNDWVQIRYYESLSDDDLEITVSENTSSSPRKYNLLIYGSPAPIIYETLEIIQEGIK